LAPRPNTAAPAFGFPPDLERLVNWVEETASSRGGLGLFLVAFLDSSCISLPEINEVLVVFMLFQ